MGWRWKNSQWAKVMYAKPFWKKNLSPMSELRVYVDKSTPLTLNYDGLGKEITHSYALEFRSINDKTYRGGVLDPEGNIRIKPTRWCIDKAGKENWDEAMKEIVEIITVTNVLMS